MNRPLYEFLLNKWYFDQLYNLLLVRPAIVTGKILWKFLDEYKTFLISPTTLWIVLNYMVNLIKDHKINENSQIIYQHLKDLTNEISRLEGRVKKMDSHFSNAQSDLNDILITTKKNY